MVARSPLAMLAVGTLALATCGMAAYTADWASLDKRPTPDWFDEAKFGIFIHWGVYSVPSWAPVGTYAEWYWNDLENHDSPTAAFHNRTYGPNFPYAEFAPRFTAELFDPVEWVNLIQASGARYVVPTSKHHEGFCLWPSAQSWNWNSVDVGPRRDLIGDLLSEVRTRKNLHPGFYFSLYEWFHPIYRSSDPHKYVTQVMLPQLHDLINSYKPHILWTDGEWEQTSAFWNSTDFLAWLFNDSPVADVIAVNDRWGSDTRAKHGGFYTPEYSSDVYAGHKWEENSGIDIHSYGLNRNTPASSYYTAKYLVDLLIRCVVNGGNFLLDIGPSWDGRIPTIMQERLLQIGAWMGVNGDAIYSSRPWRVHSEVAFVNGGAWTIEQGQNNVYGSVQPGQNATGIIYMGTTATAAQCQAACQADKACVSFTWQDDEQGDYALMCYFRTDGVWAPTAQEGHVSGVKEHLTISYTQKPEGVYAIVSDWLDAPIVLPSPVPSANTTVRLLGSGVAVQWSGTPGQAGITIAKIDLAPGALPCEYDWVFALTSVA